MAGKTFLVAALVLVCLTSCAPESACIVESSAGVDYCIADITRAACDEHATDLFIGTATQFKRKDCGGEGFTKVCDDSDVSVAEEDACTDIGEPWATGEGEPDDAL